MKFAFLGYSSEQFWSTMSKGEQEAMLDDCFTYDSTLLKGGLMIGDGVPLQPARTARTLSWQTGAVVVTDGPFAETKELLGGIGVLEARDIEVERADWHKLWADVEATLKKCKEGMKP
jgi:hypothetical protein